jgi:putative nucleotidyltransferase-like protein
MPSLASSREIKAGDLSAAAPLFSSDPEFRLLLACCAVRPPDNIYDRDGRRDLNWQRVLHLAGHHGVTPLIYRALRESAAGVPTAIQSELRERYEHNARRNLVFVGELIRVLDCLEAHAIDVIPYKGPVLAEAVYGDLALREFYDLDVLIRPGDVARASEALRSLSYAPNVQLSSAQQRASLRSGYECAFDGPLGKNLLEMQWAIVPHFFSVDFDVERFLERATRTDIGGHPVKTLCAEDLLLTLCVHAAKHGWVRLCWLRDIASVTETPGLDWDSVLASAKDLGILRIVGVSLVLAVRLLQVSMPDSVLRLIQADATIPKLSDHIAADIPESEAYSTESLEYFRLMVSLRERVSDRLHFAARLAFTPSVGEWDVVRLPAPLFPLYRVVRLFRVAGRLLSLRSN